MRENELLERAFAMPLTNPAYPPGPYRFVDREYLTITYRTDPAKLRTAVPPRNAPPAISKFQQAIPNSLGLFAKGPGIPLRLVQLNAIVKLLPCSDLNAIFPRPAGIGQPSTLVRSLRRHRALHLAATGRPVRIRMRNGTDDGESWRRRTVS